MKSEMALRCKWNSCCFHWWVVLILSWTNTVLVQGLGCRHGNDIWKSEATPHAIRGVSLRWWFCRALLSYNDSTLYKDNFTSHDTCPVKILITSLLLFFFIFSKNALQDVLEFCRNIFYWLYRFGPFSGSCRVQILNKKNNIFYNKKLCLMTFFEFWKNSFL